MKHSNIVISIEGNNVIAFTGATSKRTFTNNEEWQTFLDEAAEKGITSFLCSSSIDFPEDSGMSEERLHEILGEWDHIKPVEF